MITVRYAVFRDYKINGCRTGRGFEDTNHIGDNSTAVVDEIAAADKEVKAFLREEMPKIIRHPFAGAIIMSQIHP